MFYEAMNERMIDFWHDHHHDQHLPSSFVVLALLAVPRERL